MTARVEANAFCREDATPNNRLTGIFSPLNAYREKMSSVAKLAFGGQIQKSGIRKPIELFLNKESGRLSSKKAMEGAHRWGCKSETTVR
jgi:hypothetical protein